MVSEAKILVQGEEIYCEGLKQRVEDIEFISISAFINTHFSNAYTGHSSGRKQCSLSDSQLGLTISIPA